MDSRARMCKLCFNYNTAATPFHCGLMCKPSGNEEQCITFCFDSVYVIINREVSVSEQFFIFDELDHTVKYIVNIG